MASNVKLKDPNAVLDYKFNWSDWLASGETISTITITAESGITVDSSTITDTGTTVTVWLSSGTAGNIYDVACLITTSDSRTDERTMKIRCQER